MFRSLLSHDEREALAATVRRAEGLRELGLVAEALAELEGAAVRGNPRRVG